MKRLIAVDIGNSRTCLSDSKNFWSIKSDKTISKESLRKQVFDCAGDAGAFTICSVVPKLTEIWADTFDNTYFLDYKNKLFTTSYPKPEEIGPDVIAATIAATELYSYPNIVVDFGTATNINVVDGDGIFLGGIIMPGIESSLISLIKDTNLLELTDIECPESVVGRTTPDAINIGIVKGEIYRVEGLIKDIQAQYGKGKVITTGGWSNLTTEYMHIDCIHEPELVLKGLFMAYK